MTHFHAIIRTHFNNKRLPAIVHLFLRTQNNFYSKGGSLLNSMLCFRRTNDIKYSYVEFGVEFSMLKIMAFTLRRKF